MMKELKVNPILLSVLAIACIHYGGLGFGAVVLLLAIFVFEIPNEAKSNICQWVLFEAIFDIAMSAVGYLDRFWNWFWAFFREDYYETYDLMTGKLDIFGYLTTFLGLGFFIFFAVTLLNVAKNGKIRLPFVGGFVDKFFYPGAAQAAQPQAQPQQFTQPVQQFQAPPVNNGQQPPMQ